MELNIIVLADELCKKTFLLDLLRKTDLNSYKLFYQPNFKKVEKEIGKIKVDFFIFFSNDSDLSISNIDIFLQKLNIETPAIIVTTSTPTSKSLKNADYYKQTSLTPELLEKTISSNLEKQKLSLELNILEEKYENFNSLCGDIVWEWNISTDLIKYNSTSWTKIFDQDKNNGCLLFTDWLKYVEIEDRNNLKNYFDNIISDVNKFDFAINYKMNVDGKTAIIHEKGFVKRNAKGEAENLIGISKNITQKINSEKEVKRLSHITEETINGVLITDPEGYVTWCNKSFSKLTGYALEELKGKKPGNLLQGPETSKVIIRYMSGKIRQGKSFKCDLLNYNKSGQKYWVRIFCQPQFDESGKLESFFSTISDISSEIEAHQKAFENETKYRSLIEYSKDGLSIVSGDKKKVDILAGENILGYSNIEYQNKGPENYIHPDDLDLVKSAFDNIIKHPSRSESREYRAYKKGIGYIWIESTFHNMLNVPSVKGIVANFRDINDRKLSAELLRLSEEKYRVLFNKNPLGLVVWDPKTYRVLEVNETACKEYGYSHQEFIGLDTRKIIHPKSVPRFINYANELKKGAAISMNYLSVNLAKDGSLIYIDIVFQPFNYFGMNASLAMIKNINEQVKLEKELSEERKEKQKLITEAVLRAQEQERAHIGRELHDNINQILATTRLYIEYAQKTPELHDSLLNKARDFILSAIQEIRSLSKSVLPPSISEVGLTGSIDDLLDTIKQINHFKFKTSWKLNESLLSPNLKLAIFRIVQEQLNNVIKHSKAKNVSISIIVIDDKVVLKIKDDGIGFEKGKESGGVGLKNIESRAALFNGTIEIDSFPGKGTLLKVDFCL